MIIPQEVESRDQLLKNHNTELEMSESRRDSNVYSTSNHRWPMLIGFSLSNASTSIIMMQFSSISVTVGEIYDADVTFVNLNVMVFLIAYVIMNFPTIPILEWSMKWSIRIGAIAIVAGAWMRYLVVKTTGRLYLEIAF